MKIIQSKFFQVRMYEVTKFLYSFLMISDIYLVIGLKL